MTEEQRQPLGAFPYVMSGLSYFPLIGVPFGVVVIIWGLVTNKRGGKNLALIGTGGIVVTVALPVLFYFWFVQRGGVYDKLRAQAAEVALTSLVQAIEFYKIQHGQYPQSLEALRQSLPKNSMVSVFDPTRVRMRDKLELFYYELVDEAHYYLLGEGADGQPFTDDDLLPQVEVGPSSKVGLLIKGKSQSGS